MTFLGIVTDRVTNSLAMLKNEGLKDSINNGSNSHHHVNHSGHHSSHPHSQHSHHSQTHSQTHSQKSNNSNSHHSNSIPSHFSSNDEYNPDVLIESFQTATTTASSTSREDHANHFEGGITKTNGGGTHHGSGNESIGASSGLNGSINSGVGGSGVTDLDSSLLTLGRSTETLLRTMRLDVVILGSREEEMREKLDVLEQEWSLLEGMVVQGREHHLMEKMEKEKKKKASTTNNANGNGDGKESGIEWAIGGEDQQQYDHQHQHHQSQPQQETSKSRTNSIQIIKNECSYDTATTQVRTKNPNSSSSLGTQSTQPTTVNSSISPTSVAKVTTAGDSKKMSSMSAHLNRENSHKSLKSQGSSNFDWGCDASLSEEARRNSMVGNLGLGGLFGGGGNANDDWQDNQRHQQHQRQHQQQQQQQQQKHGNNNDNTTNDDDDVAPLRRMFRWGKKPKDAPSTLHKNNSASSTSLNSQGSKDSKTSRASAPPWLIFGGGNRGRGKQNNQQNLDKSDMEGDTVSVATMGDISVMGESVHSSPPFQMFGGGNKGKHHQERRGSATVKEGNPLQRLLFPNLGAPILETNDAGEEMMNGVPEEGQPVGDERGQSSGSCGDNPSSSSTVIDINHHTILNAIQDISNLPPLPSNHPYHSFTEPERINTLTKLHLKLRGCDSAASSLHQLVSLQKRNLLDLQYERNRLQSSSQSSSSQAQAELENLQQDLNFTKVERRRKMRLLEEADQKRKRAQDREEMLQEELETVRTELFMLRTQMSQLERNCGEDYYGGVGNGAGGTGSMRSATRQKILIVGGDDNGEDEEQQHQQQTQQQQQQQMQQQQYNNGLTYQNPSRQQRDIIANGSNGANGRMPYSGMPSISTNGSSAYARTTQMSNTGRHQHTSEVM